MSKTDVKLVLINGLPGVGKTTLQTRLAKDLNLPTMGKDTIKEFLFDHLGVHDREWSRVLGVAAIDMLHILVEQLIASGETLIIENAFYKSFAAPQFKELSEKFGAPILEVYCFTDDETRIMRYKERTISGRRHPGHADSENFKNLNSEQAVRNYLPLEIGEVVKYDTTAPSESGYKQLLSQIRHFLATQHT
ncbi:MAG TPA: ATP-binding protein [Candidatus Saccharimonadales bacterium]|nr:ATP-binding protein [Candidatus Saccharimonadales bacterium]